MSLVRVLICIGIMALVTYLPRMLPLTVFQKKINNRFVKSFLAYVPYAVLAAMTIPDIFFSTSSVFSAVVGLVVALFLSRAKKSLLTVAIGSVLAVFVTEFLVSLLNK